MRKLFLFLVIVSGLQLISSCGKHRPGYVIKPTKMENLLYDYHIASVMSMSAEMYKRGAYLDYVFEKHGVTKAEFDTSMVWYTRNGEELAEIYKNVQTRLEREEARMKLNADRAGNQIDVSMSGDTVDLWQDRTMIWVSPSPLTNKLTYDLKADTTFKPNDIIEFTADFSFVPLAVPAKGHKAAVGLRLLFDNDSLQGDVKIISMSGTQSLKIRPDSAFQLKSVNGFVYYSQDDPEIPGGLLINNIHLMRYHSDGLPLDSIVPEPVYEMYDQAAEEAQQAAEQAEEMKRIIEEKEAERKSKAAANKKSNSNKKNNSTKKTNTTKKTGSNKSSSSTNKPSIKSKTE